MHDSKKDPEVDEAGGWGGSGGGRGRGMGRQALQLLRPACARSWALI